MRVALNEGLTGHVVVKFHLLHLLRAVFEVFAFAFSH